MNPRSETEVLDGSPGDRPESRESIGHYLAAQRQLRGISVEELSRLTRIPLRSLERLESGSYDRDIDGFVRGFVRTVAEALGLDAEEAVARTRPEPGERARGGPTRRLNGARIAITLVAVCCVVLLAALVQTLAVSRTSDAPPAVDIRVLRRDPIRALAEAQGVERFAPAVAQSIGRPRADGGEVESVASGPVEETRPRARREPR